MLEKRLVALPSGTSQEIRVFSDANIQRAISNALAALPDGKAGAVLRIESQADGVDSAIAARLGAHWSIVASYGYRRTGPDVVGAEVLWSW